MASLVGTMENSRSHHPSSSLPVSQNNRRPLGKLSDTGREGGSLVAERGGDAQRKRVVQVADKENRTNAWEENPWPSTKLKTEPSTLIKQKTITNHQAVGVREHDRESSVLPSTLTLPSPQHDSPVRPSPQDESRSSLRRAVRATLIPPSSMMQKTVVSTVAPPTPRSLLSNEMKLSSTNMNKNDTDNSHESTNNDQDESFFWLCSPERHYHTIETTTTATTTIAEGMETNNRDVIVTRDHEHPPTAEPVRSKQGDKAREINTVNHKRLTTKPSKNIQAVKSLAKKKFRFALIDTDGPRKQLSNNTNTTRVAHSPWMSTLVTPVVTKEVVAVSTCTSKGGICMDLSSMFGQAIGRGPADRSLDVGRTTPKDGTSHLLHSKTKTRSESKTQATSGISTNSPLPSNHNNLLKDTWADQQSGIFKKFLNHTLNPHADMDGQDDASVHHRRLLQHQRLATTRRRAIQVFQRLHDTRERLFHEIRNGRFTVRSDRDLCADLTVRRNIVQILTSYQPVWLRVALEAMFGNIDLVNPTPGANDSFVQQQPQSKMSLKQIIAHHVFSDSKLLGKYTGGKCKVPSGKFELHYRAELANLALYRLLVLFFFLDQAKLENCLEKPLFVTESHIKSTREVLLAFSRDVLHGQGDFCKQLSRLGLHVRYQQQPIEEIDFTINCLALDLRDGTRLARLAELWKGLPRHALISRLRLPAVSRLQKIHNVRIVLESLHCDSKVAAHHVVDGHRERVLHLLWILVADHCLMDLMPKQRVIQELCRLEKLRPTGIVIEHSSTLTKLLELWVNAVCSRFVVDVREISFATMTCYLIHYYHPKLICRKDIDESRAVSIANRKFYELGGIPDWIPSDKVDEGTATLVLAAVCSRLLESSSELRACRIIQWYYRVYRDRVRQQQMQRAACTIWKIWIANKPKYFVNQRARFGRAVAILEKFVLGNKSGIQRLRHDRLNREQQRDAVILMQKAVRRHQARRTFQLRLVITKAAVTIQCAWRMWLAYQCLWSLLERNRAAHIIQSFFKTFVTTRQMEHTAAIHIQRMWRGFSAQICFHMDLQDIIEVQRYARGWMIRRQFQRRESACRMLQNAMRTFLHRRREEGAYNQRVVSNAAQIIQGAYVQYRNRLQTFVSSKRTRENAIVTIQAHVRGHWWRNKYLLRQKATRLIQRRFRVFVTRQHYMRVKSQVILVQAVCRAFIARNKLATRRRRMKYAVTRVQAIYRGCQARDKFQTTIFAATRIQSSLKGYICRSRFIEFRRAVVLLQSKFRTKQATKTRNKMKSKITMCQSFFRMWLSRRRRTQKLAAVQQIQYFVRRCLEKRSTSLQWQAQLAAQSIQKIWRGRMYFVKFHRTRNSLVLIQANVRRCLANLIARKRRDCTSRLQKFARSWLIRHGLEQLILKRRQQLQFRNHCIVAVQSCYRGYLIRREFRMLSYFATQIQRMFRGYLSRLDFYLDIMDIVMIQSYVRMFLARRMLLKKREYIIRIQYAVRRMLATQFASQESAALTIQKTWRCYTVHIDYLLALFAIIKIQCCVRRFQARRKVHNQSQAVIVIQSLVRMVRQKSLFKNALRCCVVLQSRVRARIDRARFLRCRTATVDLQRTTRGFLARLELELENYAATEIQKIWRGFQIYSIFACQHLCAIQLQCIVRGFIGRRRATERRQHRNTERDLRRKAADFIGSIYFAYKTRRLQLLGAQVIQRGARRFLARRAYRRFQKGIVQAQSVFRGLRVRRTTAAALKSIFHKLKQANARSLGGSNLCIGYKTMSALQQLQNSRSLSEIMAAIRVLEMATRLSEQCCESFSRAKAADILFSLIRTCNRSLPHVELLHFILLTMWNVARYDHLLSSLETATATEVYLDLVQMFRDKESVFCLAVSLLDRVIKNSGEVRVLCSTKENLKRLRGVLALCLRKLSIANFSEVKLHPKFECSRIRSYGWAISSSQTNGFNLAEGTRRLQQVLQVIEHEQHSKSDRQKVTSLARRN